MMLEDATESASRAPVARRIAAGRGWAINDVVCRLGPQDRSGEERFDSATIAVVLDGLFECRSNVGTALLYPGAFFLGNAGTCFECGHDYGVGDRCVAFHFDAALFEEIAATAAGSHRFRFPIAMLPSGPNLAPSVVEALLHATGESLAEADETAILTADFVIRTVSGLADAPPAPMPRERRRLIRAIDYVEEHSDEAISLDDLCAVACMSKYHFLRCFRALTGVTTHQCQPLRMKVTQVDAAGTNNSTNARLTRQKSTLFQSLAIPLWFPTGKNSVPTGSGLPDRLEHGVRWVNS